MSGYGSGREWRQLIVVAALAATAMGAGSATAPPGAAPAVSPTGAPARDDAPIPIGPTAPVANPDRYGFPRSILQVEPFGLDPWLLAVPLGLVALAFVALLVQWTRARSGH